MLLLLRLLRLAYALQQYLKCNQQSVGGVVKTDEDMLQCHSHLMAHD